MADFYYTYFKGFVRPEPVKSLEKKADPVEDKVSHPPPVKTVVKEEEEERVELKDEKVETEGGESAVDVEEDVAPKYSNEDKMLYGKPSSSGIGLKRRGGAGRVSSRLAVVEISRKGKTAKKSARGSAGLLKKYPGLGNF